MEKLLPLEGVLGREPPHRQSLTIQQTMKRLNTNLGLALLAGFLTGNAPLARGAEATAASQPASAKAAQLTLKDLSRYEGVWKTERKDQAGKPQLSYRQNRIHTNTALMSSVEINLDPESREVTSAQVGWVGLSRSGEQFYALTFSSGGWVAESVKVPKSGGFVNQVSATLTNGSRFTFTGVDDFLSDTELRSTWVNVIGGGTFTEQGRVTTSKKTDRSSIADLVEHKELVIDNKWRDLQPLAQLAPLKRLLGHWQVKDSAGKEELNCWFDYRGGKKWLVERWDFGGGNAGLNISGIDPLTGNLTLWSIGRDFMGKTGRWDELSKDVLGQVQGGFRIVREFPDAKTYQAHWQQLTNGSFVDRKDTSYTAKLVEESK